MKQKLLMALAAAATGVILGAPAQAGHQFTQGDTSTPVWLQEGQAVYIEQFYAEEYDETPGNFSINFDTYDDDASADFYDDPANVPEAADTSDPDWYKWGTGDVIEVTIVTKTGEMTWTAAFDEAVGACAYTFCGYGFDASGTSTSGSGDLTGADIPEYTAWGTFLPEIDTIDSSNDNGLSIAEINAAGEAGMASLAPYFFGADGLADPAVAFATADADSDGVVTEAEMGTFVWESSLDIFDALEAATGETAGVLNEYGILFKALHGNFALAGYRIADVNGLQFHGSGAGPVTQDSVCTPPNCGPDAEEDVTEVGTTESIERVTVVVDQALRQATQQLIGASEQEVDVNFNDAASPTLSSSGLSMSTSGQALKYRWAARVEGAFDHNADLGNTRNGSFVVAYGLQPELDLGVYGTRRFMDLSFGGYGFDGAMTSVGVYLRKRAEDGLGAQWKLSLGTAFGSADISRADGLTGAEAGQGNADLTGKVASFELGYGKRLGQTLLTPYGRLTYSSMGRGAYTESAAVGAPLSFDAYSQSLTTLTLGVNAEREINAKTRIVGGLFVTHDLARSADDVGGSSSVTGLEDFEFASADATNATRVGANFALYHDVGQDARIYTRVGAQMASHSDKPTYSLGFGFETRF